MSKKKSIEALEKEFRDYKKRAITVIAGFLREHDHEYNGSFYSPNDNGLYIEKDKSKEWQNHYKKEARKLIREEL